MKRSPLNRGTKELKANPEKTREWQQRSRQPLKTGDKALQRTEMKRCKGKKAKADDAALDAATPDLVERSEGRCEAAIPNVCTGTATDRHHRNRNRSDNRLVNLMHLCANCHTLDVKSIHQQPDWAKELGFLVKRSQDPAEVPVIKMRRIR